MVLEDSCVVGCVPGLAGNAAGMALTTDRDRYHRAAWEWLTAAGTIRTFYGTTDVEALWHVAGCGLDVSRSGNIGEGRIPTFADTFSEPADYEAIAGAALCKCGRQFTFAHDPLSVGELLAAVVAHENSDPAPSVPCPAGPSRVAFDVPATGRLWVDFADGKVTVPSPRRGFDQPVEWAAAVTWFGPPAAVLPIPGRRSPQCSTNKD